MPSLSPLRVIAAIQERPWAITQTMMDTIREIMETHVNGEKVDLEAVAARIGRPLENAEGRMEMRDHIAVIGVQGPIFRRADMFTRISGATSIDSLATDFQVALDSGAVNHILLDIDSPGGQIDGINEFADMVRAGSAKKPVTAYIDGQGASGAYWIASAANQIIANESSTVGSIGVVASMTDRRGAQERQGVKHYEIVSSQSPYKRPDPATEAGRAQILEIVDSLAGLFIGRVAAFRGTTAANVEANYGQGRILPARKAMAAGMIDEIGSFEPLVARLAADSSPRAIFAKEKITMADVPITPPATPIPAPAVSVPVPPPAVAAAPAPAPVNERARIEAILESEEARNRQTQARHLAFKTDLDAETAKGILRASPMEGAPAPANPLAAAMAAVPNPKVGVGGGAAEDSAEAEAARVLAFVPKHQKVG